MNIKIITYGCSNNFAESEIVAGLLKKEGHKIVNENEDLVIINTCAVKEPTEKKILEKIRTIKKPLIVIGCLVNYDPKAIKKANPNAKLLKTHQFNQIVKLVNNQKIIEPKIPPKRVGYPRIRVNPVIEIIPISSGCLGNCTYCCVKNIKGKLISFPKKDILKEIKNFLKENVKEIWLTSQDNGCYGFDINTNLIELLKDIIKINKKFWLRVGMMNPQWVKNMTRELIEIYNHKNVFKFLHIPVQSGSDKILKLMNRPYKIIEFKKIVKEFRKNVKNITISTDIIVGFPGEKKSDFNKTLSLIKWLKPEVLNISRYWVRKNTEAEKYEQVDKKEIKKRSTKLTKIYENLSKKLNKKWVGWEGEVLIDEKNKGKNIFYKSIHNVNGKLGEFKTIKVKESKTHYLIA